MWKVIDHVMSVSSLSMPKLQGEKVHLPMSDFIDPKEKKYIILTLKKRSNEQN